MKWNSTHENRGAILKKTREVIVPSLLITSLKLLVTNSHGTWPCEGPYSITNKTFPDGLGEPDVFALRHQRVFLVRSCEKLQDEGWILLYAHLWYSSKCTLVRYELLKLVSTELWWVDNRYTVIFHLHQIKYSNM